MKISDSIATATVSLFEAVDPSFIINLVRAPHIFVSV